MKKSRATKPLALHMETIRQLNGDEIQSVAGGTSGTSESCTSEDRRKTCRTCPTEMEPQF